MLVARIAGARYWITGLLFVVGLLFRLWAG